MFIEQTIKFEFRGLVLLGRVCTPATGYFYDKTKLSKENLRVDYYLLLKYCRRECILLSPTRVKLHTKYQNARSLNVLDLTCKLK